MVHFDEWPAENEAVSGASREEEMTLGLSRSVLARLPLEKLPQPWVNPTSLCLVANWKSTI